MIDSGTVVVRGAVVTKQAIDRERMLWTLRLQMPPGGGLPFWTNPGLTVLYVESGAIGFTSVTGTVLLTTGLDVPERAQALTGAEYLLRPGDTASFGPGTQQSLRNPVTQTTSLLLTMIGPRDARPYADLVTSEGYPIEFAE